MKKKLTIIILLIGAINSVFSQTLDYDVLNKTIEGKYFAELNRLYYLTEKKEYDKAIDFIMLSNLESNSSLEVLIPKETRFILSYNEFNDLQKILRTNEVLFFWWPVYEIYDLEGNLIAKTQLCTPDNPTEVDLTSFYFPKNFGEITDKCYAENLKTLTTYSGGEKENGSIITSGDEVYHEIDVDKATKISYIIHPGSNKYISFSDTRIKTDMVANCNFDIGNLVFRLNEGEVIGEFDTTAYLPIDKIIKTKTENHILINAFEIKQLINNNDTTGLADYLSMHIGSLNIIKLLLKYAGNECVNYRNSKGRTSVVEAFVQGKTNGDDYTTAYDKFMTKRKGGNFSKGNNIEKWEAEKYKPQKVIDILINAGARVSFDEDSYSEILSSKENLEDLDNQYFTSFFMSLVDYIEKNNIQADNKIIRSIINSDYSNYSDLSNDRYRFDTSDNFLISYALLDILDVKPSLYYRGNGRYGNSIRKVSAKTNSMIYGELTKQTSPLRLYIFLASIYHSGSNSSDPGNFWDSDSKIKYLNEYDNDIINQVILDYTAWEPYNYDDYLSILERYNSNSELIDFFKGIEVSHIKSRYLKRSSRQDIREAIKYLKSKR